MFVIWNSQESAIYACYAIRKLHRHPRPHSHWCTEEELKKGYKKRPVIKLPLQFDVCADLGEFHVAYTFHISYYICIYISYYMHISYFTLHMRSMFHIIYTWYSTSHDDVLQRHRISAAIVTRLSVNFAWVCTCARAGLSLMLSLRWKFHCAHVIIIAHMYKLLHICFAHMYV